MDTFDIALLMPKLISFGFGYILSHHSVFASQTWPVSCTNRKCDFG